MAPDGELSFGAAYFQNNQRYNLSFQALPWLETSFRYSGLDRFNPDYPVYWDRSFAMKARLWSESELIPSVAIGINDLVGTGVYSGEYIVASKQFGDLDATAGLGWGRLGSFGSFTNPFSFIAKSFDSRFLNSGAAGQFQPRAYFHGPAAAFGGVVWHTPLSGLSLTAEYSSDGYVREMNSGNFSPRNHLNFGANYAVTNSTTLGVQWLYGRSIGGTLSFTLDPTHDPYPQKIGPEPPQPVIRTPKQQQEALNLMAGQRRSVVTPSENFSATEVLSDALWKQNGYLSDVAMEGRSLSLTVRSGNLEDICRTAARTVGQHELTITSVRVSSSAGRVTCPVAALPAVVLLSRGDREFETTPSFTAVTLSQPITIDAITDGVSDSGGARGKIRADAVEQHIGIDAMILSGTEAVIYYTNGNYFSEAVAIDRLVRLLMKDAPPQIEKFRLIAVSGDVPLREFDVLRAPIERRFSQEGGIDVLNDVTSGPAPMQNPELAAALQKSYPQLSWDVYPQFRQELFDPVNPLGMQFLAAASGTIGLLPGLSLNGEVEANVWENFNNDRPSDSVLPHVRTDAAKYFTQGKNGIGEMEADYWFRFAPDVFAVMKVGYLESMFAGVGGEVLWRPEGRRWALGGDLYEVQQRDFDRLFGLQPYHAVTGHISLYYASPWYGLNFIMRAGQYLARDRGITFEVSRRFSTGVEVGVFATKTNISSAQFGEGSFDKGIFLRIPIGWTLPAHTQSELDPILRAVQRDGGQELAGDATLYEATRRTSEAEIVNIMGTTAKN